MKIIRKFVCLGVLINASLVYGKPLNCFLKVNSRNMLISNIQVGAGVVQTENGQYRSQYYISNSKVTQIVVLKNSEEFLGMTTTSDAGTEELNYWIKNGDDIIVSGCKVVYDDNSQID